MKSVGEVTWYGRFAVWVGAVVLLAQAIAGRGAGLMSLLSVILLAGGLVTFVYGLFVEREVSSVLPVHPQDFVADGGPPPTEPELCDQSQLGPDVSEVGDAQVEEAPSAQIPTAPAAPAEIESNLEVSSSPRLPKRHAAVHMESVSADSPLLEASCARCGDQFAEGDVVAVCPMCFQPHHAPCWVDNGFKCSVSGCIGAGVLQARTVVSVPENVDPSGGPSKP